MHPWRDSNGGVGGIVIFSEDITERKRAEAALRESEARFRTLVDSAPDGVFVQSNGKVLYLNPAMAALLGAGQVEELIGKEFIDWVAPESRGIVHQRIQTQRDTGMPVPPMYEEYLKLNGSRIPVETTAVPLRFEGRDSHLVFVRDITERKTAEDALRAYSDRAHAIMTGTIEAMSTVLEVRDPYTAGHERRVAHLACAVAAALGWDSERLEGVRIAGYMHDLGKIAVPAEILSKPGHIGQMEMGIIQSHPKCGYDILSRIAFTWPVALVALQHHERLDGSGYPQHLKGDAIIPEARLLAVADVVEAMSSHRPYRPALPMSEALEEITGKPHLYDSEMASACKAVVESPGFVLQ